MAGVLAQHPYLAVNLVGTAVALLAVALAGRHRGTVLLAGAIETLHAPLTPLFDGVYWSPQRLGGLAMGIEDVLVCFSLGAGAWFCAVLPWQHRLEVTLAWAPALRRLLWIALLPALPAAVLFAAGATVMESLMLATVVTAAALLARRPALWRLPAAALALYVPYYSAFLIASAALVPGFAAMWDGPELWGPRLLGVPVDELAWVASFALCFPLVIGTVLDARIAPRG